MRPLNCFKENLRTFVGPGLQDCLSKFVRNWLYLKYKIIAITIFQVILELHPSCHEVIILGIWILLNLYTQKIIFHYRNIDAIYAYSDVVLCKVIMYAESLVSLCFRSSISWEGYVESLSSPCIRSPKPFLRSLIYFFLISITVGFQLVSEFYFVCGVLLF